MMIPQPATLLVIEDNKLDVLAFRRGLRKHGVVNPVTVAENGRVGLEMLRGENGRPPLPRPVVTFLDLNMPVMNGLEFLSAVRDDDALSRSVVFVLTTSDHDNDVEEAYEKNVAGYILKKNLSGTYGQLVNMLRAYLEIVTLPE